MHVWRKGILVRNVSYLLENNTRQWIWSGCLWSDLCNTRVFFLPGKENAVWPRESPKVYFYTSYPPIVLITEQTHLPGALTDTAIMKRNRTLPLPLTHGESGRHVGPLGGRETLEKKCSRVEARAQSRKNIQMERKTQQLPVPKQEDEIGTFPFIHTRNFFQYPQLYQQGSRSCWQTRMFDLELLEWR